MLESVQLLSAGFCLHPEATTIIGGSWRPCRFPAGFALIVHSRFGAVLFDTGYSDHFLKQVKTFYCRLYKMIAVPYLQDRETACNQLSAAGIKPSDVRFIVVSHFHADHIAGLKDFPSARIVCSRSGWQSVCNTRGFAALAKGFIPELMPDDIEQRLSFIEDAQAAALPPELSVLGGGADIFGDGSVIAVSLPGHAVGQIGILIVKPPGRPILLVADAAWSTEAVKTCTPPPPFTTDLLGNTREYRQTLARLSALKAREPDLLIVPSHCGDALGMVAHR